MFSVLLAANLRDPLGSFLAANWTQFPREYAYMLGFLIVFLTAWIGFTVAIQTFYTTQPLWEKYRFVDEVIGGILGVIEAGLLLVIAIVILDSFFLVPGIQESGNELHFIRDFWNAMNEAQVTAFFRDNIVPVFFAIFGIFIPDDIEQLVTG
jgi:cytochrome c biogenesis protein CcdA